MFNKVQTFMHCLVEVMCQYCLKLYQTDFYLSQVEISCLSVTDLQGSGL